MAWVNDEWLDRKKRQEVIDTTKELIDTMLSQPDLTFDETIELDTYIQELARLERIHRSETDLLYFSWEYFSESRNPGNPGNWDGFELEKPEDAPNFHIEICEIINVVSTKVLNEKVAVAAPRSHAKSSYLSKANPLRETVFRKRKYIMIISETPNVAMGNLEWLANQLKFNKKLRNDFGPLLHHKQQMNPKDNSTEFVAFEQPKDEPPKLLTLVQAASSNQAIRGRNWNGTRPDMIICDDLEDPKSNAGTKEQREKLKDWFAQSVIPLGDAKGERTAYIYMGTIVHAESLLNEVIKNYASFKSRLYKALIEEPERQDLWEKCRSIFLDANRDKSERKDAAKAFYLENKEEMDLGAVVLWEEVQPIYRLMEWKWEFGSKAFNTEFQNTPRDEESQTFIPEKFRKFDESDLFDQYGRSLPLESFTFWDVAQGRSRRSDFNAIVTVSRNQRTGIMFTRHTWAKKCQASVALEEAVEIIKELKPKKFGVETIGVGYDQYMQLKARLLKEKIYHTKVIPISSHTEKNKEKRIENLEPLIESGFLRFMVHQRLLFDQLEQFPQGTHDDLPDALAGAVDLAGGIRRSRKSYFKKPVGL